MDAPFRIEMLGRFAVRQGSREITRFRTQKTGSLLACLAYYHTRSHPRDELIEQFWPESDLKAARTNLSVALTALRRQFKPQRAATAAATREDGSPGGSREVQGRNRYQYARSSYGAGRFMSAVILSSIPVQNA